MSLIKESARAAAKIVLTIGFLILIYLGYFFCKGFYNGFMSVF